LLLAVKGRPDCELVLHHHDWWFDNRWQRWSEMQSCGYRSVNEVASVIFAAAPNVRHITISRLDASILQRSMPDHTLWLPNPLDISVKGGRRSVRTVRKPRKSRPIWLMTCRLLRRKNIAEGLLLTRWLRPEATLVTTAGISSPDEGAYAEALQAAAMGQEWPLRLGILSGLRDSQKRIEELLQNAEALLLTSLQEGFGLPYIEAAAASRPLFARRLPNIAPDLESFGLHLPYVYDEILVDPSLFNWRAEMSRQRQRFQAWLKKIPPTLQSLAGKPAVLAERKPHAVPFSRLTLRAQIEVLSKPVEHSWSLSILLNPWLEQWRDLAASGRLQACRLSRAAATRLAPEKLATCFWQFLGRKVAHQRAKRLRRRSKGICCNEACSRKPFSAYVAIRTMKIRAVILDLYGTLLEVGLPAADSVDRWNAHFHQWLQRPPPLSRLEFVAASSRAIATLHEQARARGIAYPEVNWEAVVSSIVPELAKLTPEERDSFLYHLVSTGHSIRLMTGAVPLLKRMAGRGMLLGIASNAQAYTVRELNDCLSQAGESLELFTSDICFWSYQHGFSKPDPHVFQILTARLERKGVAAKEILMVGDRMDNDINPPGGMAGKPGS
jgi:putative hydrolase of the HAD superfamily